MSFPQPNRNSARAAQGSLAVAELRKFDFMKNALASIKPFNKNHKCEEGC
jgi:hypothetical protein